MSDPAVTPAPSPELRPRAAAPLTPPPQVAEGAEGASVSSPPELPVASECSSTADSSPTSPTSPTSQSSSSSATEAALKAVSEGELLSNVPLEDTLTGSASPAPSPASSSCSLTPLSLLSAEEALCTFSVSLQEVVSIVPLMPPSSACPAAPQEAAWEPTATCCNTSCLTHFLMCVPGV